MKKFLALILSLSVIFVLAGCSAKEQTATYVMETEEAGMLMTDTQTLMAKGDIVYELDETTVIDFSTVDAATQEALVAYYDEVFGAMKDAAPETVTVNFSNADGIYTVEILINVKDSDVQELIAGGYLSSGDTNAENIKAISFKQTCEVFENSGYVLQQ